MVSLGLGKLTLGAARAKPAQLAVALLARRGGGLHVHAAASVPAVAVVYALIAVLTARSEVQSVTAALGQQVAAVSAAVLLVSPP